MNTLSLKAIAAALAVGLLACAAQAQGPAFEAAARARGASDAEAKAMSAEAAKCDEAIGKIEAEMEHQQGPSLELSKGGSST
jgi:hypothetical protein